MNYEIDSAVCTTCVQRLDTNETPQERSQPMGDLQLPFPNEIYSNYIPGQIFMDAVTL
jgi:hypothetical protein